MMKAWYRFLSNVFLLTVFIVLMCTLKISYIWGSAGASFSLGNSIRPLIGLYGGLPGIVLYAAYYILKGFWFGTYFMNPLFLHIPTMCSALYWAWDSWIIKVGIPIVCIILFMIHPVGSQALFYTLFWLIPLAIYLLPQKNVLLHALASTFIAHAVGSVLWLYWIPMNPELFVGLIPIVLIERLVFATGMTLTYYMCESAKILLQSIFVEKPLKQNI
jgi:hypothetical protein